MGYRVRPPFAPTRQPILITTSSGQEEYEVRLSAISCGPLTSQRRRSVCDPCPTPSLTSSLSPSPSTHPTPSRMSPSRSVSSCSTRALTHRPQWIEEVRSICGPTIPVILVGCKSDLRPPEGSHAATFVTTADAQRVANAIGARAYKECSALKIEVRLLPPRTGPCSHQPGRGRRIRGRNTSVHAHARGCPCPCPVRSRTTRQPRTQCRGDKVGMLCHLLGAAPFPFVRRLTERQFPFVRRPTKTVCPPSPVF